MPTTPPATPPSTSPASARVRKRRAVPLAVTAVAAAGLLTACASTSTHQTGSTPAGGATTPGSTTQTPGATSSASPAGTGSPSSGTAGLAVCQSASLRVTVNASQAGGAAAQENPGFGRLAVRLAAGGVAHAWLQVAQAGNYPPSTCQPVTAHWLRVFAPGETVASYVNHDFAACSSAGAPLLTVMPVRAGQGVHGTAP